jgi:hypothetical protein
MKLLEQSARFLFCIAACLALAACNKTNSLKKIFPEAARQSQLDWNLKTTVGAYEKIGNTSPAWDEPATNALAAFAKSRIRSFAADENWAVIIRTNCIAAVQSGCDDPMIRYLYIRFCMDQTNSPQDFAEAFCGVAFDMQKSSYPDIRKFYAAQRAADQLYYAYGTNMLDQPDARKITPLIGNDLMSVIGDKSTPPEEAFQACDIALTSIAGDAQAYPQAYAAIEPPLFANWPDESTSWLLKGEAYTQMGWNARGSGFADTVTAEGEKTFVGDLAIADQSLNHAWKLNPKNPRIAVDMMRVILGEGHSRDQMELWFNRAMQLDTNDYSACSMKLLYIEPKWYGSVEDMLEFGHECVQSTNWGGNVSLILVDAHFDIGSQFIDESERTNYCKRPEVWPDIKAAYDRFFELNPNATDIYKNYAWYAYHAEQWDAFNELAKKVRPVDYNFFGGEVEFNKMVQLAKDHASKPAVTP